MKLLLLSLLLSASQAFASLEDFKVLSSIRKREALSVLKHRKLLVRRKRWWGAEADEERAEEIRADTKMMSRLMDELRASKQCWSDWSAWTACDGPCQSGRRRRTRSVNAAVLARVPGFVCPGFKQETQRCHRKCGAGGVNDGAKCKCEDGWKSPCCDEVKSCPKPTDDEIANRNFLDKMPYNGIYDVRAPYRTTMVYNCREGYVISGRASRVCQLNEMWSGEMPTCAAIACATSGGIANGEVDSSGDVTNGFMAEGAQLQYECDEGFRMEGSSHRTCRLERSTGKGIWSFGEPRCQILKCGDPGVPSNARRTGNSFNYGDSLLFACNDNFQMIGSTARRCVASGEKVVWDGVQPRCQHILCPRIAAPLDGFLDSGSSSAGSELTFTCRRNYRLVGSAQMHCLATGSWDATPPKCVQITCPDPGIPQNGARIDDGLAAETTARFVCHAGYVIDGPSELRCGIDSQQNGVWNGVRPNCTACPKNTYQSGAGATAVCRNCPDWSATESAASHDVRQCVCIHGYRRAAHQCIEIKCDKPDLPASATFASCNRKLGDTCHIRCNPGYFVSQGRVVRTCTVDGSWDGTPPICSACPRNTYQSGETGCLPCPKHQYTVGSASVRADCVCRREYVMLSNGTCADLDECSATPPPCQDGCVNTQGGYVCRCDKPGQELNPDEHTCKIVNQCSNLTRDDAPKNGRLVCHWFNSQSSQRCEVNCNPRHDQLGRVNKYELCGPSTNFEWNFKHPSFGRKFDPCMPIDLAEFGISTETNFITNNCSELTAMEKEEIKRQFVEILNSDKVCIMGRTRQCQAKNAGIICGKTRKRRSVDGSVTSSSELRVDVALATPPMGRLMNRCRKMCAHYKIPESRCTDSACLSFFNRRMKRAVSIAGKRLQILTKNKVNSRIQVGSLGVIEPSKPSLVSPITASCEPGMSSGTGESCVECSPGHFERAGSCVKCSKGHYQPNGGATSCLECPSGEVSKPGSASCQPCPTGFYGKGCQQRCQCRHGICFPADGTCICQSGWEGERCDVDTDGCRDRPCFEGVQCTDAVAPDSGFSCGQCPNGSSGDGISCR